MHLAFFTPLSPVQSGISDYSEELLPFLAEHADIDIVIDSYQPSNREITERFRVIQVPEFQSRLSSYDCIIYQFGNNYQAHGYMLACLAAAPGIVVLHDYSLTYLILPVTAQRGDLDTLVEILQPTHGTRSRTIALRLLAGMLDPYEVSLCRPVVEMGRAVIVHNQHALGKLRPEFPHLRIQPILHATPIRDLPADTGPLKRAYGFQPDDIVLASISSLAYNKRTQLVLETLHQLHRRYANLKFVMVGQGNLGSRAQALIERLGLSGSIVQTGWVPGDAYLDYIALADIVVDLRYPTAGETSGSSLRAMQAAKPLVVSAEGFFLELPEGCCIRLPVNNREGEIRALRDALDSLIQNPERRQSMGNVGRQFALANLRIEQAANSYMELIREVAASPYPPTRLWNFEMAQASAVRNRLVAWGYKAGRLLYSTRKYGLTGTFQRVIAALKAKN